MKSPIISAITALVIISFSISCSSIEVTDESVFREKGGEEVRKHPPTAAVDDFRKREDTQEPSDITGSDGEDDPFHGFTREEIEMNRMVTIDKDGNEKISTDEEVILTLKRVRQGNSTFLRDEPHFNTGTKRRNVIGRDDRFLRLYSQRNAPYSAIGYLSTGCTAYLVGPRHLITAAHCLHPRGDTQAIYSVSQLTFYLRRNCYSNGHGMSYGVSEVLLYSQYRTSGDGDYDIAYLLLTSNVSIWMGFAYKDPLPTVSGEICGYPWDKVGPTSTPSNCFYCSRCNDVIGNNNRLEYTCDTEGGMSGSPVMIDNHDSSSRLYSYGVHTQGFPKLSINKGVCITRTYFYDICRWKCDTGARCSAVC